MKGKDYCQPRAILQAVVMDLLGVRIGASVFGGYGTRLSRVAVWSSLVTGRALAAEKHEMHVCLLGRVPRSIRRGRKLLAEFTNLFTDAHQDGFIVGIAEHFVNPAGD